MFRREYAGAREVLNRKNNRLWLVLATLISVAISFFCFFLSEYAFAYALELTELGFAGEWFWDCFLPVLAFVILFWLFALPVWLGSYRMAVLMTYSERVTWLDVFHYTASAKLWRRSMSVGGRVALAWLPFVWFLFLGLFCPEYDLSSTFGGISVLLFPFGFLITSSRAGITALMVGDDGKTYREARIEVKSLMKKRRMRLLCRSVLHFVIQFAAIVGTVGLLFLFHTLPMAMLMSADRVIRHDEI